MLREPKGFVFLFAGGPLDGGSRHLAYNESEDHWDAELRRVARLTAEEKLGVEFEVSNYDSPKDETGGVSEFIRHVYRTDSATWISGDRLKIDAAYVKVGPIRIVRVAISDRFSPTELAVLRQLLSHGVYENELVTMAEPHDVVIVPMGDAATPVGGEEAKVVRMAYFGDGGRCEWNSSELAVSLHELVTRN